MSKKRTNLPVQKNERLDVTFQDLTHEGAGVAKVDGYPLFVPDALPGEEADVKVVKTGKNFGFGRLMERHTTSTHRVDPPCPIFHWCGGCQLQHMDQEAQLALKRDQVVNALHKYMGRDDIPVQKTIGMDEPWAYRNKAQVPVAERDGELIAGFFAKRSHHIVDMDHCLIQGDQNDAEIQVVKNILKRYEIKPYDEVSGRGVIRHIVARNGRLSGETMVMLITNGEALPHKKKIVEAIRNEVSGIHSIAQNINKKKTNVIYGERTEILWGEKYIEERIGKLRFALSPRSFFQVNPVQTEVLYEKVRQFAGLRGNETVIDAYCGIGSISLFLAEEAKKVYGVEVVGDAISDARKNAKLNHISNVEFSVGKAEEVVAWWRAALGIQADVIVVDPPRKGCDEKLLQTMIEMQPERIVYASCNPATLARDLGILSDGGYEVKEVQPVDMFPQTVHIECVVSIRRKDM
ncbi:23S rRNA (uracil(1939)-C(5))-methyltransferase RlmD [Salicibibacter cibarius]|uniref:23S rRNA (Uracil(1939)-C(5))-methyltransferase RlmD n=1 Tax=Salicibibacter cibarius TaxID=2743000 RepID=A0A7T6Z2Y2_9BACI|nr:23S rRNA (uracil(1939)-C(5))-methyltransferase RlmD [Salicibibacter cibarius]QQK75386.1 23S rRNA (uracil(1939)-C(5))-methyltransferase RlmD [Salicibibacter cibarius]